MSRSDATYAAAMAAAAAFAGTVDKKLNYGNLTGKLLPDVEKEKDSWKLVGLTVPQLEAQLAHLKEDKDYDKPLIRAAGRVAYIRCHDYQVNKKLENALGQHLHFEPGRVLYLDPDEHRHKAIAYTFFSSRLLWLVLKLCALNHQELTYHIGKSDFVQFLDEGDAWRDKKGNVCVRNGDELIVMAEQTKVVKLKGMT